MDVVGCFGDVCVVGEVGEEVLEFGFVLFKGGFGGGGGEGVEGCEGCGCCWEVYCLWCVFVCVCGWIINYLFWWIKNDDCNSVVRNDGSRSVVFFW